MNQRRKYSLYLAIFLILLGFAGLTSSCGTGTSTLAMTGTAALDTSGTRAPAQADAAAAPAGEKTPAPEPSPEGESAIAPEAVQEISDSVAERTPVPTPTSDRIEREVVDLTTNLGIAGKTFLGLTSEDWFNLGISALIVVAGYFVGTRLLKILLRWIAHSTTTEFDDTNLIKIVPDLQWLVVLFVTRYAVLRLDFLSEELRTIILDIFFALGLVIITTIGIRLINLAADWYKDSLPDADERLRMNPVISAAKRSSMLVLLVVMLSIGLSHFGINLGVLSITVLLAALIVSFGAKDAISDAISGFIILVDQPFRVHDGIQIRDADTWGDVQQIGTRTTRILTRDNREVIIPNTKMLNSQVTNYTYPDPEYRMQVDLHIAYGSDLEKARQVIIDTLKEVDGVLTDKGVEVLFIDFGDSARKMRARWWISDYHQDWDVRNKVCTAIDAALESSGIDIPITSYDLNVKMEGNRSAGQTN